MTAPLQDRIMAVLTLPQFPCTFPITRAIDRLWIDDEAIPSKGFRLWWAVRRLRRRGLVRVRFDGAYIGLSEKGTRE